MSIRITVLSLFVGFLCVYSFRNWFISLCGGLLLLAFLQHGDMPRSIAGIPGLNLLNILLFFVTISWIINRQSNPNPTPLSIKLPFLMYCSVVVLSFVRLTVDPTIYYNETAQSTFLNYFFNPLKFLIPAVLMYDGCRSRDNTRFALVCITIVYFLFAFQVIRAMGINLSLSGDRLSGRAARVITREVGFHRVDMSMMLAGGSWALFSLSRIAKIKFVRLGFLAASAMTLFGMTLTGGRTGYVTWGLVGLGLAVLRWRKLLLLIPITAIAVTIIFPGVKERMLSGFGNQSGPIVYENDDEEITSGRTTMWPYVIDKIKENPLVGYGRLGMVRTGLYDLSLELRTRFRHPHNAYLEMLLDNGILGFAIAMPVYFIVLFRNISLFRNKEDRLFETVGGVTLSLLTALLVAAMGAQTFYPREGIILLWAAMGISMRLWTERRNGLPEFEAKSHQLKFLDKFLHRA